MITIGLSEEDLSLVETHRTTDTPELDFLLESYTTVTHWTTDTILYNSNTLDH